MIEFNRVSRRGSSLNEGQNEAAIARQSRTRSAQIRRPEVNRSYIVPVLGKAIRILQLLEKSEKTLNVDEIVRETDIAKSTVYRILRTFSAYGYLPDGADGLYHLRSAANVSRWAPPKEGGRDM